MSICKYFLQGNCRYGNNCKFDHPIGKKMNEYSFLKNCCPKKTLILKDQRNYQNQQNNYNSNQFRYVNNNNNNYNYSSQNNLYQQQNRNYSSQNSPPQQTNKFAALVQNRPQNTQQQPVKDSENITTDQDQEFL
jgi:hypothetical protein